MFGKDPMGRKNIVVIRAKREQEPVLSAPAAQGGREIISIERCGMLRSSEVLHCGVWTCKMWRLNNLLPCPVQATQTTRGNHGMNSHHPTEEIHQADERPQA